MPLSSGSSSSIPKLFDEFETVVTTIDVVGDGMNPRVLEEVLSDADTQEPEIISETSIDM